MGISDRQYNKGGGRGGRGGGRWGGGTGGGWGGGGAGGGGGWFERVFKDGVGFFGWSLPLYRAWGIAVRLHLLFLIYIIVRLLDGFRPDGIGFIPTLQMLVSLFGIVLLHEYGHCIACRKVGGEADRILLWPLGGLAFCRPPHNWKADFITTAGGPMVNVLLFPIFGAIILATGGGLGAVFFNPFSPNAAFLDIPSNLPGWLGIWLVWTHIVNTYLLLFNVLLPMYPMDGGRLVHALLWRKMGYERGTMVVTNIGLFAAVVVGTIAVLTGKMLLLGIAIFAGITSWQQKQAMRFAGGPMGGGMYESDESWRGGAGSGSGGGQQSGGRWGGGSREYSRAAKQAEDRRRAEQEIDEILAKVAQQGMQSLTRAEKRRLEKNRAVLRKRAEAD